MASLTITRLNNPGAIEDGPFARNQPGYAGSGGRFAKFVDEAAGIAAQENLLANGANYRDKPIVDVIKRYSPVSKENSPAAVNNYIDYVSQKTGLDPTKPIPRDRVGDVAAAMREFETGRTSRFKPSGRDYVGGGGGGVTDPRMKTYTVGEPTPGESKSLEGVLSIAKPGDIDSEKTRGEIQRYQTATDRYAGFLEQAIAPLHENAQQVVQKTTAIAATKENLFNDFQQRAADLEAKIIPLQEKRQQYLNQLAQLDEMSPLEARFKAAFNSDWDPRIIRGKIERIDNMITGYETTYQELNQIRSGVAALSVDADAADAEVANAMSRSVLADAQLLGQVAGAVRTNVDAQALPLQMQVETLRLQETMKAGLLGKLTLEQANKFYMDAQNSPDGTIEVDGVKLTVGELQSRVGDLKRVDLGLRSLEHSYAMQDIQTAAMLEDDIIEHMSVEQIQEALKNGGKFQGKQLSVLKLSQAATAIGNLRTQQVDEVILNTSLGQAANMLKQFGGFIKLSGRRAQEMFGAVPGELSAAGNYAAAQIGAWQKGFEQARSQGVEREYVARTASQLQAWQKQYDDAIVNIAKKWGGGKADLTAVADSYLRNNPISGDAAMKGLITIARTGMPAGSKLTGPVLQAIQVAQAIVRDWDSGADAKAGDPIAMLQGGGAKKETDLIRRVQQGVSAVYADALTDQLLNSMPDIARQVRNPDNPGKPHPFAAVSRDDFISAVRHGDNVGFEKLAEALGLPSSQVAQRMIAEGIDGPTWQAVKKEKGLSDAAFADFFQDLQATQMSATLSALDASASARPGFSPARAYIDLLNSQEAMNQVDQLVQAYGQSGFGAYLISSAAGGGYRDSWHGYAQTMAAVYSQQHSTELRNRIKQQRSIVGDPWVRMNAVLRAAKLTPQESQALISAVRPIAKVNDMSPAQLLGARNPAMTQAITVSNFDAIAAVIRHHHFDDPAIESIRKKAAREWDAMDTVVGNVFDSIGE